MEPFLGILMLDTRFPRTPGDVGNPESFGFPVRKLVVRNADPKRVVEEADPALLEPFIQAAVQLEREGASAVTTSCGFLAMFQKELAAAVHIPVLSSSLLQVPMVQAMLPAGKKVGIMTANASALGARHFAGAGILKGTEPSGPDDGPMIVYGMEGGTHFYEIFVKDGTGLDRDRAEAEMAARAKQMAEEHPEVGAIVFECTNMPPYAGAVRKATGLPVYDIISLCTYVMRGM